MPRSSIWSLPFRFSSQNIVFISHLSKKSCKLILCKKKYGFFLHSASLWNQCPSLCHSKIWILPNQQIKYMQHELLGVACFHTWIPYGQCNVPETTKYLKVKVKGKVPML
jgi:hypothetical protein